ncbi:SCP domain-containing protein [Caenorhabditis elegans]|uniref:SCP domain-containing protein n=1 Tax=Caenorhabditis elegans TaxID=6239 RepID=Q93746_CAEEL|nr:SCP domain-containing protein [Caenorhabditis elegans]CAA94350.1 SCP domain-containing protein [Caenorhabditis elegans]|eukprot:NP_502499.1 SCP-Like extracellular protein [Caenorhabditis elegans]
MKSLLLLVCCIAGVFSQFTSTGQQAIVDAHNKLRSSIAKGTYVAKGTTQKSGSNMRKIKWDATVATSAQNYANTCPTGHSQGSGYGENLYWYWTSGTIGNLDTFGPAASSSWESEFQQYGWTSNTLDMNTFNTGIGHATQMAWANTFAIGCGVKNCGKDPSNGYNKVAVVCQYKTPGNYLNQPIYQQGTTCAACPSGTACDSSGLCA